MLRQHVPERVIGDPHFRWRGGDVSRIEALTDMVFAFALTLLVVSLEVPRTFDDLVRILGQAPAFAFSFAIMVMVWYFHYLFHRRYGFEDFPTFVLNAVLLFVILLYVYPLKFLAVVLQQPFSGAGFDPDAARHMSALMVVYGLGFTLIFVLFTLMYLHAWRRRGALALNEVERYLTRQGMVAHGMSAGVGLLSVGIAATAEGQVGHALAGWTYLLMWPLHWWHGRRTGAACARMEGA